MTINEQEGSLLRLIPAVQHYAWGKKGQKSIVAQLANSNKDLISEKPYAELWIGTHPNGPSRLAMNNQPLAEYLGTSLPFLFKVLSIDKVLSIQAHPNSDLAKILHQKDSVNYPDPLPKPEMVIALSSFGALCGFRPISQILDLFNLFSLTPLFDPNIFQIKNEQEFLKTIINAIFQLSPDTISTAALSIIHLLECDNRLSKWKSIFLNIFLEYTQDPGIIVLLLLNYIELQPGDALYLCPHEPHAYIFGDCLEIMIASDNVVRAGLTPKFKDVPTLLDMLEFNPTSSTITDIISLSPIRPSSFDVIPKKYDEYSLIYKPVSPFFSVIQSIIPSGSVFDFPVLDSSSLVLCLQGKATFYSNGVETFCAAGSTFYLDQSALIRLSNSSDESCIIYRALGGFEVPSV